MLSKEQLKGERKRRGRGRRRSWRPSLESKPYDRFPSSFSSHLLSRRSFAAGFKKEQIRVRVDNYGNLRITGERPLHGSRWTRFCSDFKIPGGCDTAGIRAKFDDGIFHVTIPMLPTRPSQAPLTAAVAGEAVAMAASDTITTTGAGDAEREERKEAKIRCWGGRRRGENIKLVFAVVVFPVVLLVFYVAYRFYTMRNSVEVFEKYFMNFIDL